MKPTVSKQQSYFALVLLILAFVSFAGNVNAGMNSKRSNDMNISQRVQEKLASDNKLMGSDITVETKNGEVTLKGVVATEHDITRATKLAHYVEGVKGVDNRLTTDKGHEYKATAPTPGCQVGANWAC